MYHKDAWKVQNSLCHSGKKPTTEKKTLISLSDFEFEVFTQKPNQNNWKERAVDIFV